MRHYAIDATALRMREDTSGTSTSVATSMRPGLPQDRRSTTVSPVVNSPLVSQRTCRGVQSNSSGDVRAMAGHRIMRDENSVSLLHVPDGTGKQVPGPSSAAQGLYLLTADHSNRSVTSSGIIFMLTPLVRTSSAAVGSIHALNSAAAVMLPPAATAPHPDDLGNRAAVLNRLGHTGQCASAEHRRVEATRTLIGQARGSKRSDLPAEGVNTMHGISLGRIGSDQGPIAAKANRSCTPQRDHQAPCR